MFSIQGGFFDRYKAKERKEEKRVQEKAEQIFQKVQLYSREVFFEILVLSGKTGRGKHSYVVQERKVSILCMEDNQKILMFTHSSQGHPVIGFGADKCVKLGIDLESLDEVAVGIIRKSAYSDFERQSTRREDLWTFRQMRARKEIFIHQNAQGSRILPLLGSYEQEDKIYMITPLALGDWQFLLDSSELSSSIKVLRYAQGIIDVLRGLEHLHQKGYVHLDIQSKNILFSKNGRAYLADFSCASLKGDCCIDFKMLHQHVSVPSIQQLGETWLGITSSDREFLLAVNHEVGDLAHQKEPNVNRTIKRIEIIAKLHQKEIIID